MCVKLIPEDLNPDPCLPIPHKHLHVNQLIVLKAPTYGKKNLIN